jgi:hypothetical protein
MAVTENLKKLEVLNIEISVSKIHIHLALSDFIHYNMAR